MGLMAGPERPPVTLAMRGAAGFDVDGERKEGVDERERVGAGVGGHTGHEADAGDVGRELDHERPGGGGFAAGGEVVELLVVGAEDHAAVAGVGAGGVELVHSDAGRVVKGFDDGDAVLDRVAEDVADDGEALDRPEAGELFRDEGLHADVL